nr:hypothetical protein [Vibrio vulnificus]
DLNQPKGEVDLPNGLLSVSLLRHQVLLVFIISPFIHIVLIFPEKKSNHFTEDCIGMDAA